ncbi:MAG: LamG-like jellyroll fold domain-containing protein, partial [Cyclobacteriaceae bacterium]
DPFDFSSAYVQVADSYVDGVVSFGGLDLADGDFITIGEGAIETNYALNFDGSTKQVNLGSTLDLAGESTITLEAWIYPEDFTGAFKGIVNKMSPQGQFFFRLQADQVQAYFYLQGGGHSGAFTPSLTLNQWQHVAATFDGVDVKLYVNGVDVTTNPSNNITGSIASVSTGNTYIGSVYDAGEYFDGFIDEVRIWTATKSQGEIASFMNQELTGAENDLLAYYRLNDGPGSTTATDLSGNGYTGTLVNLDINNDWVAGTPFDAVAPTPEINLKGFDSNNPIANGSTTPDGGNDTDFGSTDSGVGIGRTFIIENTGTADLNVSDIMVDGDFSIDGISLPAVVGSGSNVTFNVLFNSTTEGYQQATVTIINDDADENPFTFDVGASVNAAVATVTENFETLTTIGYDGVVSLPTGDWTFADAFGEDFIVNSGGSSIGLQQVASGTFITPAIDGDGTDIEFFYATNGGEAHFTVWQSVDGGGYTQIGGVTTSTGSSFQQYSTTLNTGPGSNVNIQLVFDGGGSDGDLFIDDFTFVPGQETGGGADITFST